MGLGPCHYLSHGSRDTVESHVFLQRCRQCGEQGSSWNRRCPSGDGWFEGPIEWPANRMSVDRRLQGWSPACHGPGSLVPIAGQAVTVPGRSGSAPGPQIGERTFLRSAPRPHLPGLTSQPGHSRLSLIRTKHHD